MGTKPLYVRAECHALEAAMRTTDAFLLRRAWVLLASALGERVSRIEPLVGFSRQEVRDIIQQLNREELPELSRQSQRNHTIYYSFDTAPQRGPCRTYCTSRRGSMPGTPVSGSWNWLPRSP
jgi:hypothetical protein